MKNDTLNPKYSITGIILARGGSVAIPRKNVAIVGRESLLQRCLRIVKDAPGLTSIWVSTDDEEIASLARKAAVNVHWRAPEAASSSASSVDAVREFLIRHQDLQTGHICLIQCTSPFLRSCHLQEAIRMIVDEGLDSVFAAVRSHQLRWHVEKGTARPLNFDPSNRPRRQDWAGEFCETGMFYLTSAQTVLERGLLQHGRIGIVEIKAEDSLDIDTPLDLHLANFLVSLREERCSGSSEDVFNVVQ